MTERDIAIRRLSLNDAGKVKGGVFSYRYKVGVVPYGKGASTKGGIVALDDQAGAVYFTFYAANDATAMSVIRSEFLPDDDRPIAHESNLRFCSGNPLRVLRCLHCDVDVHGDVAMPTAASLSVLAGPEDHGWLCPSCMRNIFPLDPSIVAKNPEASDAPQDQ